MGTLYQILDITANMQDSFIDHSLKGKTQSPGKQALNFDEWHSFRSLTDPNQDLGPARRYDINVTEAPKYIVNNPNPNMPGTLVVQVLL
jgi:hypothetical protein